MKTYIMESPASYLVFEIEAASLEEAREKAAKLEKFMHGPYTLTVSE